MYEKMDVLGSPIQRLIVELTAPLRGGAVTWGPWYADGAYVLAETPVADTSADGAVIAALPAITRRLVDAAWLVAPVAHRVGDTVRVAELHAALATLERVTSLDWELVTRDPHYAWMATTPTVTVTAPTAADAHVVREQDLGLRPVAAVDSPLPQVAEDAATLIAAAWSRHRWLTTHVRAAAVHLTPVDEVRVASALLTVPESVEWDIGTDETGWICWVCDTAGTGTPVDAVHDAHSHWCAGVA